MNNALCNTTAASFTHFEPDSRRKNLSLNPRDGTIMTAPSSSFMGDSCTRGASTHASALIPSGRLQLFLDLCRSEPTLSFHPQRLCSHLHHCTCGSPSLGNKCISTARAARTRNVFMRLELPHDEYLGCWSVRNIRPRPRYSAGEHVKRTECPRCTLWGIVEGSCAHAFRW